MIEAGDLDGLRKLTKTIPPKDLVAMTMPGKPLARTQKKRHRRVWSN